MPDAWTAYTPTITSGSGTFTTVSGAGRYFLFGKTLFISVIVTITTNGSAAGYVNIPLPASLSTVTGAVFAGREYTLSGQMVQAFATGSAIQCYFVDNTYPGATGATILVSGTVETA